MARSKASETDTQAEKLIHALSYGKQELERAMAENRAAQERLLEALKRLGQVSGTTSDGQESV